MAASQRHVRRSEHLFARLKGPIDLHIRTIGIARARTKIGVANLVCHMKRMVWLTGQIAPAYAKNP
jgi:IS5 family transposase